MATWTAIPKYHKLINPIHFFLLTFCILRQKYPFAIVHSHCLFTAAYLTTIVHSSLCCCCTQYVEPEVVAGTDECDKGPTFQRTGISTVSNQLLVVRDGAVHSLLLAACVTASRPDVRGGVEAWLGRLLMLRRGAACCVDCGPICLLRLSTYPRSVHVATPAEVDIERALQYELLL